MNEKTEAPIEKEHGWLYWLVRNSSTRLYGWSLRHRTAALILLTSVIWFAFVFRAYVQPYVVVARVHSPECISALLIGWAFYASWVRRKWKRVFAVIAIAALGVVTHLKMELPPLRYLTLYLRYHSLEPTFITELPTTDHERIQPLNSIRVLGGEAMKEVERVSTPDFVRIVGKGTSEFRWSMAIEPAYTIPSFFGHIKEIMDVSGLAASPNFSGQNRVPVSFRVGEDLLMGKNTDISTIRSFGVLRFFSFSPRDVKFIKDDDGNWVEVVSLIRWRGFIFVWPEFGGVQVIRQGDDTILAMVKSWFCGDGEWISPSDIHKYPFLQQQNNLPYEVSRYAASSLRFQAGFCSPMPWYHKGDIRIPDLPSDENDQPFTAYFRFGNEGSGENKLYHYFALEPYHDTKQGLNTSVFIPADGLGATRIYQHYKVNEALTGVSAIPPKVMESRKQYDWEQSRPVENRPWIRDIDGKRRFFWLTTVVTYKDKKHAGERGFIAGSTPDLTLTDALYKNVVWVNPHDVSGWEGTVRSNLSVVWKSN